MLYNFADGFRVNGIPTHFPVRRVLKLATLSTCWWLLSGCRIAFFSNTCRCSEKTPVAQLGRGSKCRKVWCQNPAAVGTSLFLVVSVSATMLHAAAELVFWVFSLLKVICVKARRFCDRECTKCKCNFSYYSMFTQNSSTILSKVCDSFASQPHLSLEV